jgi:hypothetical protein
MKSLFFLLLLFLAGCNSSSRVIESIDYPIRPPLLFPPNIYPSHPPPPFKPSLAELAEVQINPLPHPFNVNGRIPYAVWVNGKKISLNSLETKALAKSLNLEFKQPKDTAQIHSGEGWLYPLPSKKLIK